MDIGLMYQIMNCFSLSLSPLSQGISCVELQMRCWPCWRMTRWETKRGGGRWNSCWGLRMTHATMSWWTWARRSLTMVETKSSRIWVNIFSPTWVQILLMMFKPGHTSSFSFCRWQHWWNLWSQCAIRVRWGGELLHAGCLWSDCVFWLSMWH